MIPLDKQCRKSWPQRVPDCIVTLGQVIGAEGERVAVCKGPNLEGAAAFSTSGTAVAIGHWNPQVGRGRTLGGKDRQGEGGN